jgi:hypothetical protein
LQLPLTFGFGRYASGFGARRLVVVVVVGCTLVNLDICGCIARIRILLLK